jgi:hypothetical protein
MGNMRNLYGILVGKSGGKDLLRDQGINGRIILKKDVKEIE